MIKIESTKKWNDTGIDLIEGRRYTYTATGHWKDWIIECDADGYSCLLMDLVRIIKRIPSAKWFQLIGVVNQNMSDPIELGTNGDFIAPANGRLWAFANDAEFAYGNNSGHVELDVNIQKMDSLIK